MIGFDGAKFDEFNVAAMNLQPFINRINEAVAQAAQRFAFQQGAIAKAAQSFEGWEPILARWRDDYLAQEAFIADGGDVEFIEQVERAYGVEF